MEDVLEQGFGIRAARMQDCRCLLMLVLLALLADSNLHDSACQLVANALPGLTMKVGAHQGEMIQPAY